MLDGTVTRALCYTYTFMHAPVYEIIDERQKTEIRPIPQTQSIYQCFTMNNIISFFSTNAHTYAEHSIQHRWIASVLFYYSRAFRGPLAVVPVSFFGVLLWPVFEMYTPFGSIFSMGYHQHGEKLRCHSKYTLTHTCIDMRAHHTHTTSPPHNVWNIFFYFCIEWMGMENPDWIPDWKYTEFQREFSHLWSPRNFQWKNWLCVWAIVAFTAHTTHTFILHAHILLLTLVSRIQRSSNCLRQSLFCKWTHERKASANPYMHNFRLTQLIHWFHWYI